jgi:hypothetical protein
MSHSYVRMPDTTTVQDTDPPQRKEVLAKILRQNYCIEMLGSVAKIDCIEKSWQVPYHYSASDRSKQSGALVEMEWIGYIAFITTCVVILAGFFYKDPPPVFPIF